MKNTILILLSILTTFFSIGQNANQFYRKADSLYNIKEFKNSGIAYNEGIRLQGVTTGFNRYISAASSWTLANSSDSAFYVLNILSQNDKLTQSDYKNIESAKELEALHSDKRWKQLLAAVQKQADANTYPAGRICLWKKRWNGIIDDTVKTKREIKR